MAKKPSITTVASGYQSTTTINSNTQNLRDAFDNTLSLDGSTPNAMLADFDMNSNDIINVDKLYLSGLYIDGQPVAPGTLNYNGVIKETQTATSGQTVFNLTTMTYNPGINSLSVYVDGIYQNPSTYTENNSTRITFSAGLHVGAIVDFVALSINEITGAADATSVTYTPSAQSLYGASVITVKSALDQISNQSTGSSKVGFLQDGTSATNRTAQAKLRDIISVKDFGAVGDGVTNDTAAMQAAHNTGRTIFYPKGTYNFTKITIPCGGIIGEGKLTILRTTDTSTDDIITYTAVDPTGILINTVGGLFTNFTLLASSATQKSAGAGISVVPALYSGSPNEDFLTICSGLHVKNIPIGVSFKLSSFFTVRDSYFSFNSIAGIYTDMNSAIFQDNGDNTIIGNFIYTNAATSPSGRGIWYRAGGARIIGNKVNGGLIGIDINPLRGTSIAIVSNNSVENQTNNAIRAYINSDFTAIGAFDGFSFVQIEGNQIGGYNLAGPAISIDSYASDPKFYNCSIKDNVIYNPANTGSRAIDIRQVDRFIVANNFVDSATVGYGSLFVGSTATSGLVSRNRFLRAATSNILNSSTTTILDEIVAEYSTTYDPASINAGATLTLAVTVTGARLGNYVSASMSIDIGGITLTAYVSASDTVTVVFFNGTASPIDIGSGTLRLRVFTN